MKPEVHLSVDLETMSSEDTAAILSIGAVVFTRDGVGSQTYDQQIDPSWTVGHRSISTRDWWMKQSAQARNKTFSGEIMPELIAKDFAQFVSKVRPDYVWANDPTFDCVILRNFYKSLGIEFPWHFRTERSFRTMTGLARKRNIDYGKAYEGALAHDAVSDAISQAKALHIILTGVGGF